MEFGTISFEDSTDITLDLKISKEERLKFILNNFYQSFALQRRFELRRYIYLRSIFLK